MFKLSMQNKKWLFVPALAVVFLSGCQTTSATNSYASNLDAQDVLTVQRIIAESCIISNNKNVKTEGIDPSKVVIFGIDKGKNGWVRVDSKVTGTRRMRRSNVYYSLELKKIYCGSNSWNASGYDSSQIF